MADGEERVVSEREVAPPTAPLVAIAVGVAFVGTFPVMLPFAVYAALLGALAAAVLGVPAVRLVIRLGFRGALAAVWTGAFIAALSPAAGLLLMVPLTRSQGGGPGLGQFAKSLADATLGGGPIAAPFGAATAIIYWSRYLSKGWASRHTGVVALLAVGITAGVFAANHEVGRETSRARTEQYAAERRKLASPDRSVSVRLVRLFNSDVDVVRLASPQEPACAIVISSGELAGRISIGAAVWVDLTEIAGTAGEFRLSRVGDVDVSPMLATARVDRCRPWR